MPYSHIIMMGDPAAFSIKKGVNPHTRNWLGLKKKVNRQKATRQWHDMAQTLMNHGVKIFVIPAKSDLPGLVFPANAGFIPESDKIKPLSQRHVILSSLIEARSGETKVYKYFLSRLGLKLKKIPSRFEGEADLIPWGERYLFTYGKIKRQGFVPRLGFPPWKRVYGFRTSKEALQELSNDVPSDKLISLELADENFYHGDTILCSFGPRREYLLACKNALTTTSQKLLESRPNIIWLSVEDAEKFAANSFQVIHHGNCILFMPEGVSSDLVNQIEEKGIKVVTLDVSEFYKKGGGSVKCMIGDLGPWIEEGEVDSEIQSFRITHEYSNYFSND